MFNELKIGYLTPLCTDLNRELTLNNKNIILGTPDVTYWNTWHRRDSFIGKIYSHTEAPGITKTSSWEETISKVVEESDVLVIWGFQSKLESLNTKDKFTLVDSHGSCAWTSNFLRYCLPFANHFSAVSNLAKLPYPPYYQDKVKVIPNQIDLQYYRPLDKDICRDYWGLPHKAKIVGYAGRNALTKGYNNFFSFLRDYPDYTGFLVSDVEAPKLPNLIQKPFAYRNMSYFYGAIDCYLSLSSREGDSLSLKEALACNTPSVVTDTGSSLEMHVKDPDMFSLVTLSLSNRDIADAIEYRINNPIDSREYIRKNFSDLTLKLRTISEMYQLWRNS